MRYQKQPCKLRVIYTLAEMRVAETTVAETRIAEMWVAEMWVAEMKFAEMKPAETRLVKAKFVKVELTKTKVVKTGLNLLLARMANLVKPVTLWMKLVDANTFQPAIKYAFASTVSNNLLSYNKKLTYSSAGGAIEFANPGPVTNQPIIAHKIRRAYQAYGTPIP